MRQRLTLLLILLLSLATMPLTGAAQEDEPAPENTISVPEPGAARTPAVTVPDQTAGDETPPWTARFLVPAGLALAVLVVIMTIVQYFVRVVRTRYKVIE